MYRRLFGILVIGTFAAIAPRVVSGTSDCGARIRGSLASALPADVNSDPVIEEPIRPLLPGGPTGGADVPRRCGAIGGIILMTGLLGLAPLSRGRRRRAAHLQTVPDA